MRKSIPPIDRTELNKRLDVIKQRLRRSSKQNTNSKNKTPQKNIVPTPQKKENKKVILYYSHNSLPLQLEMYFQNKLFENCKGIPIIAVVKNIRNRQQYNKVFYKTFLLNDNNFKQNDWKSILKQMDIGIDYILDNFNNPVVYLAEHDVLYHSSYFDNVPNDINVFIKNHNLYFLTQQGFIGPFNDNIHSQTIGYASLFKHCIHEKTDIKFKTEKNYKLVKIFNDIPSIDVRHGFNYTGSRNSNKYIYRLPYWGTHDILWNQIGKKTNIILVGNGESILNYDYGKLIDSYDIVVRFNSFYIAGFEAQVGKKTTIWVTTVYNENYMHDYQEVIWHSWHGNVNNDEKYLKIKNKYPNVIRLNHKSLISEIKNYLNIDSYDTYSTGALTAWYFLKKYKSIDIIGFDWWFKNEKDNHHYGDKEVVGRIHKPLVEFELFSKLMKENKINDLNKDSALKKQPVFSAEEKIESEKYNVLYADGYPPGDPVGPIIWANKNNPNIKVLDVGCGRGVLSTKFKKYTGIDVAGFIINENKKHLKGNFYNCGILGAKDFFKNEVFDLVVSLDVLEHLPQNNLDEYLMSLSKIRSKEFLFSICCRDSVFKDKNNNSLHLTLLSRQEWINRLTKYFKIIKLSELNNTKTFSVLLVNK